MSKVVWLVMANADYELNKAVAAFESEASAKALVARINAYEDKRPRCPEIEDTPENDALWEKFTAKDKRWRERHPTPDSISYSSYTVEKLRLKP